MHSALYNYMQSFFLYYEAHQFFIHAITAFPTVLCSAANKLFAPFPLDKIMHISMYNFQYFSAYDMKVTASAAPPSRLCV